MIIRPRFLGIGSGFNTKLGNSSAFFYDDDNNFYLIDCGFDVFNKIIQFDLFKDVKNVTVFITHLHDDHIGSLATLLFYTHFVLNIETNIKFSNFDLARYIKLQGALRFCKLDILRADDIKFNKKIVMSYEFIPVTHCNDMPAYGLKLSYIDSVGIKRYMYYSGDTKTLFSGSHKFDDIFASEHVQIYQECTHLKHFPETVHMDLDTLSNAIPLKYRHHINCMHLGDCTPDAVIEKGFNVPKTYPELD